MSASAPVEMGVPLICIDLCARLHKVTDVTPYHVV